jgi:hypothetical protein
MKELVFCALSWFATLPLCFGQTLSVELLGERKVQMRHSLSGVGQTFSFAITESHSPGTYPVSVSLKKVENGRALVSLDFHHRGERTISISRGKQKIVILPTGDRDRLRLRLR